MNLQVQEINLDINDNHVYQHLYTKQYDANRVYKINIYKDGLPYDISDTNVAFEMKKPDGTVIMNACEITSTNQISISLTPQMSVVYGRALFQIVISKNENIITTVTGKMNIEESVIQDDDVRSSDEFGYITEILAEISTNANLAHDSAVAAKSSEDNAKESEDNARASELAAKQSEDNAKDSEDAAYVSEVNAKDSEDAAKDSEDAAKASELAAKTSEDNAKASEIEAKAWADKAAGNATSIMYSATEPLEQDEGGFWIQPFS